VKERDFFAQLDRHVRDWGEDEQVYLLRTTIALASASPKEAFALYRDLPASLANLAAPVRTALLHVLAIGGRRLAGAAGDLVPVAGALLQQVPAAHALAALAAVERVAQTCPEAVVAALRSLPRVYEEADEQQVENWFAGGLRLARDNREAALAFFALESRTSLKVLRATSTGATLEEVQGLLRKYVTMLSGAPASIRSQEGMRLRSPLEEFPAENEIALPLRIELLATHEDNLRLYRFLRRPARRPARVRHLSVRAARRRRRSRAAARQRPVPLPHRARARRGAGGALPARRGRAHPCPALRRVPRHGGRGALGGRPPAGALGDAAGAVAQPAARRRLRRHPAPGRARRGARLAVRGHRRVDRPYGGAAPPARRQRAGLHARGRSAGRGDRRRRAVLCAGRPRAGRLHARPPHWRCAARPVHRGRGRTARRRGAAGARHRARRETPPVPQELPLELSDEPDDGMGGAQPISPEELRRLLESGANLRITQGAGQEVEGLGLYVTDLIGKVPSEQIDELRQMLGDPESGRRGAGRRFRDETSDGTYFSYDEWDYHIDDYRSRWCRLYEVNLDGDSGEFFNQALGDYARLIPEVRRQFQRIRPEMYRTVRGLEDGEDFDLNAAIAARVDARAGLAPSSRVYVARKREERDVATLFLVDMSASTDEPFTVDGANGGRATGAGRTEEPPRRPGGGKPRRIIDVTKETLVIMAEALEEIGDAYAIYGFSGHGRERVEVYRVKSFAETLSATVKGRLGGIEPKRSTRMGTALRHAVEKLAGVTSRSKHLFLLSDGFPQDYDYGQDRRSNVYGIRDTAVALREAEAAGVTPFCITVDKAGHDYLRQMCDESRYMVIEDITALPRELPKIYQRVVRA
jgi:hypothetical protein